MELRVVLIDGNPEFLTSAQRFLETLPGVYASGFSTASRNVVPALRAADPDLVLLDITLPSAIRSRLENTISRFKKAPWVVYLSFHEKGAQAQYLSGASNNTLVNKDDFVAEIVSIIHTLRASASAEHSL